MTEHTLEAVPAWGAAHRDSIMELERRVATLDEREAVHTPNIQHLAAHILALEERVFELEAPDGATWTQIHTLMERVAALEALLETYMNMVVKHCEAPPSH